MAFEEKLDRLASAQLILNQGITRIGSAGLVAENVEFLPRAGISKRPGYRRFLDIQEAYPVTGIINMEGHFLVMAGDLDEQDE